MAETPTGPLSLAKQRLKVLLANSATWQTWTGQNTPTLALTRIYLDAGPRPASGDEFTLTEIEGKRPFAIVSADVFEKRRIAVGSGASFDEGGSLMLQVQADVAAGDVNDDTEASVKFHNNLANVIDDMCSVAGSDPGGGNLQVDGNTAYLNVAGMKLEEVERSDEDAAPTEGNFFDGLISVEWGF